MKNFKKFLLPVIVIAIILTLGYIIFFICSGTSHVMSDDIELDYGISNKTAFLTLSPKSNGELHFTGNSSILKNASGTNIGIESDIKLIAITPYSGTDNKLHWQSSLEDNSICRWNIEFKDKIIIIENGKLIKEINISD